MVIAVDFDGTIVEHQYPNIGPEIPFAIQTLKALQEEGHYLILWTFRTGRELVEATEFCQERGLTFYAVNENFPGETLGEGVSRKINADLFLDDRNLGGIPDWGVILQRIREGKLYYSPWHGEEPPIPRFRKRNWMIRLGEWFVKMEEESRKYK